MQESLVALLTDFGTRDPYVASVRGVIASRCRTTQLDLTHEIAPFDVFEAAAFLHGCLPWLPPEGDRFERVVVLAVVDPGVGTDRRIVAMHHSGRWLVAPDNGLLARFARDATDVRIFSSTQWDLPHVTRTFHGRDRFAPLVAALVTSGAGALSETEGGVAELTPLAAWPAIESSNGSITGTVIAIDRFGNCITDVDAAELRREATAALPDGAIIAEWRETYGSPGPEATPFLIAGSRGTVEISVTQASAADLLQIRRGDRVRFQLANRTP